jgi:hypothetical protein
MRVLAATHPGGRVVPPFTPKNIVVLFSGHGRPSWRLSFTRRSERVSDVAHARHGVATGVSRP